MSQLECGDRVWFGPNVVIGHPREVKIEALGQAEPVQGMTLDPVVIGEACRFGANSVIGEGCTIGSQAHFDENSRVGFGCTLGNQARVMYGAFICDRVRIGARSRIAGFVCDAVTIGNDVTCMGNLVHAYSMPDADWGLEEASPVIEDCAVIGYGAAVIGGVRIGHNAYIAANATVTRDVPPKTLVTGKDHQVPAGEWRGTGLSASFWTWQGGQ